jgi:hypothetical protein
MKKENKEIYSFDEEGECHGYQEWYNRVNNNLWFRAYCKHGGEIGYGEIHQQDGKGKDTYNIPVETSFYIR